MKPLSISEEDYIKNIFILSQKYSGTISTSDIAIKLNLKSSSITSMLKKLEKNQLIKYQPYQGVKITEKGKQIALKVLRKHRLWETFLYTKLKFDWRQVHKVAEQLEHIDSDLLIDRLDELLNFPMLDPHGDPIPDKNGKVIDLINNVAINTLKVNEKGIVTRVLENNEDLLQYLEEIFIQLNTEIEIKNINSFDNSIKLLINQKKVVFISQKIAEYILVKKV